MSPATLGLPGQLGHGQEFWQNVVHWRREWQTTSVFLLQEPHEQYEKQQDTIAEDEPSRLVAVQYGTGKEGRNSSRENDEAGPKQKQHSMVMCLVGVVYVPLWQYLLK